MQEKEYMGRVTKIRFQSPDGYRIFELELEGTKKNVTCKGHAPAIVNIYTLQPDCFVVRGIEKDGKYGLYLDINYCRKALPVERGCIENFFRKNIPGVGRITANRIVKTFGKDTLTVIINNPERLLEVKGVNQRVADKIKESVKTYEDTIAEESFWHDLKATPTQITKIKNAYGYKYREIIESDPYVLYRDIPGFGFATTDKMARNMGIGVNAKERIVAGVRYTLEHSSQLHGHTHLSSDDLLVSASETLGVPKNRIEMCLDLAIEKRYISREDDRYYLPKHLRNEIALADIFAGKLVNPILPWDETDIIEHIHAQEEKINYELATSGKTMSFYLDQSQIDAVVNSVNSNVAIITGGPGTGKTTILKIIISWFERQEMSIVLAAPTGKAAIRMREQTKHPASTIHSMLSMHDLESFESDSVSLGESHQINGDVLIVDESSMIDLSLMTALMRALKRHSRVIFIGDVNQLPSIGAGNVLRDLIKTDLITTSYLTVIHRQSADSTLTQNAANIINGKMPDMHTSSDWFVQRIHDDGAEEQVISLLSPDRIQKYFNCSIDDIQILCPIKEGASGVINLNNRIQAIVHPNIQYKRKLSIGGGVYIYEGDRVIHTKNNYGLKVMNGEIGKVLSLSLTEQKAIIAYSDPNKGDGAMREITYESEDLAQISLAYAITIHKSQGSELTNVIMPMATSGAPSFMTKNLLYTGITRAKTAVILLTKQQVIQRMVKNNSSSKRNTYLCERIIKYHSYKSNYKKSISQKTA